MHLLHNIALLPLSTWKVRPPPQKILFVAAVCLSLRGVQQTQIFVLKKEANSNTFGPPNGPNVLLLDTYNIFSLSSH